MGRGADAACRVAVDEGTMPAAALPEWCRAVLHPSAQSAGGERTRNEEHLLLRRTGRVIVEEPGRFAATFHRILFTRVPELRALFPDDLALQQHRFAALFARVLDSLEAPDQLAAELDRLGRRHRGYGATFVHYLALGEALIAALAELNGPGFGLQARLAWSRLYSWIVYRMRHAPRANENGAEVRAVP